MDFQHVKCVLCNSDDFDELFVGKYGISVVKCRKCGMTYANPILRQSNTLYNKEYFLGEDEEIGCTNYISDRIGKNINWARHSEYRRLKRVLKYKKRGKLLELGCATGFFLNCAREHGWDVQGVEISDYASQYARDSMKLNVITGTLEPNMFEERQFDVVVMWHVIEHVPYLNELLRESYRILKDDGLLFIATPNDLENLKAKLSKDKNRFVKLPEHIYFFNPRTISLLLEKHRFQVKRIYTEALPTKVGKKITQSLKSKSALMPILKFLKRSYYLFLKTFNLGYCIVCIASKGPFKTNEYC